MREREREKKKNTYTHPRYTKVNKEGAGYVFFLPYMLVVSPIHFAFPTQSNSNDKILRERERENRLKPYIYYTIHTEVIREREREGEEERDLPSFLPSFLPLDLKEALNR